MAEVTRRDIWSPRMPYIKNYIASVVPVKLNIKHLLVFLAPNIIFIGQMEKDIGRGVSRVQYLSTAEQ